MPRCTTPLYSTVKTVQYRYCTVCFHIKVLFFTIDRSLCDALQFRFEGFSTVCTFYHQRNSTRWNDVVVLNYFWSYYFTIILGVLSPLTKARSTNQWFSLHLDLQKNPNSGFHTLLANQNLLIISVLFGDSFVEAIYPLWVSQRLCDEVHRNSFVRSWFFRTPNSLFHVTFSSPNLAIFKRMWVEPKPKTLAFRSDDWVGLTLQLWITRDPLRQRFCFCSRTLLWSTL